MSSISWLIVGTTAPAVFLVLLVFICAPLFIFNRKHAHANTRRDHVLSMCNCFAAGVFLSACLLGLIPHAQQHERDMVGMFNQHDDHEHAHNDTEHDDHDEHGHAGHVHLHKANIAILCGFLLIFVIEQFVVACEAKVDYSDEEGLKAKNHSHTHRSSKDLATAEAPAFKTLYTDGKRPVVMATEEADRPFLNETSTSETGNDVVKSAAVALNKDLDTSPLALIQFSSDLHQISIIQSTTHGGHGHSHAPTDVNGRVSLRSLALLIGLSVHSVLEGLAVGLQETTQAYWELLIAVMAHEVLCAFAYGCSLLDHQRRHAISLANMMMACFVAATIPFGLIVGRALPVDHDNYAALQARFVLEGVAAGTFIYVACMEMLATEFSHQHACGKSRRWPLIKVVAVCAGAALFAVLSMMIKEH